MADPSQKFSDRVWDVATKVMVPVAFLLGTAIINHETRLSNIEAEHQRDHLDVVKLIDRMDRLIDRLEVLGNRLTVLETVLKQR